MNTSGNVLQLLEQRFCSNTHRHTQMEWSTVAEALAKNKKTLATIQQMEESGGEPDVVVLDPRSALITFVDCSAESPSGRRSLCYDSAARTSRKENAPSSSAMELAQEMGVTILTESQYILLQKFGPFDMKTSSWISTPADVRERGGALFGDYRFGRVFVYHNGAQSYYASRGFRGLVTL